MIPSRSRRRTRSVQGVVDSPTFSPSSVNDTPVGLQDAQDVAVDLVQFPFGLGVGTHRGYASVKRVFAENCRQI